MKDSRQSSEKNRSGQGVSGEVVRAPCHVPTEESGNDTDVNKAKGGNYHGYWNDHSHRRVGHIVRGVAVTIGIDGRCIAYSNGFFIKSGLLRCACILYSERPQPDMKARIAPGTTTASGEATDTGRVTPGGSALVNSPPSATVWGLSRTARNEVAGMRPISGILPRRRRWACVGGPLKGPVKTHHDTIFRRA